MKESAFDRELLSANMVGAKSLEKLYKIEKTITHSRILALKQRLIEGKLDYTHLKAIHRFLFSDIYSWAGRDRYEANIHADFGKGGTRFTLWHRIPEVSQELFDALFAEHFFAGQSRDMFTKSIASFMNGLNLLHPFREGNGRVQRIFVEYLGSHAGHPLSFDPITAEEMMRASIEGARGHLWVMEALMRKTYLTPEDQSKK